MRIKLSNIFCNSRQYTINRQGRRAQSCLRFTSTNADNVLELKRSNLIVNHNFIFIIGIVRKRDDKLTADLKQSANSC